MLFIRFAIQFHFRVIALFYFFDARAQIFLIIFSFFIKSSCYTHAYQFRRAAVSDAKRRDFAVSDFFYLADGV